MVELKAKEALTGADEGQLINYLKATGLKRGLLLNFGTTSLQHKRMVWKLWSTEMKIICVICAICGRKKRWSDADAENLFGWSFQMGNMDKMRSRKNIWLALMRARHIGILTASFFLVVWFFPM